MLRRDELRGAHVRVKLENGIQLLTGITPPPGASATADELQVVQRAVAQRTPEATARVEKIGQHGGTLLPRNMLGDYVRNHGVVDGVKATVAVAVSGATTSISSKALKALYGRPRPYTLDPSMAVLGKTPVTRSYPSGHAATAHSAATVLSARWPERAASYQSLAREAGEARVYSGVHYPSDVAAGEKLVQFAARATGGATA